jgi:3'-phosphoadenosine 5'-phosphosulfate sulfotransferase (PAPS reductase)/FAD synthetase
VQRHGCQPIIHLRAAGKWVDKFWMFPIFLALCIWKGRFPSAKARFCTEFLKIKPTEKFIKELIGEGHEIISHSGVRAAESIERSTMQEWDKDMFGCITRRPLLRHSLSDVWDGHKKYGLPINPLYFVGWKRVGCRLCIMSSKPDVRRTVTKRPWVIAIYRTWELVVGAYRAHNGIKEKFSSWFHRRTVPMAQRSKLIQTKTKGQMMVATIDDVARWSQTVHGGKQGGFEFMFEEESFNLDDAHAPCQSGYCE